jgi:hypothetical protein
LVHILGQHLRAAGTGMDDGVLAAAVDLDVGVLALALHLDTEDLHIGMFADRVDVEEGQVDVGAFAHRVPGDGRYGGDAQRHERLQFGADRGHGFGGLPPTQRHEFQPHGFAAWPPIVAALPVGGLGRAGQRARDGRAVERGEGMQRRPRRRGDIVPFVMDGRRAGPQREQRRTHGAEQNNPHGLNPS